MYSLRGWLFWLSLAAGGGGGSGGSGGVIAADDDDGVIANDDDDGIGVGGGHSDGCSAISCGGDWIDVGEEAMAKRLIIAVASDIPLRVDDDTSVAISPPS